MITPYGLAYFPEYERQRVSWKGTPLCAQNLRLTGLAAAQVAVVTPTPSVA
jgi:hypothetical protein